MKKLLFIAFLSGIGLFSNAQTSQQDLSEKVKITFPGKPESHEMPNGAKLFAYTKDSVEAYMGLAFDLSTMGLQQAMIDGAGDMIWDQVKQGFVAQFGGAVISKEDLLDFKGHKALYLEIDGKDSNAPQLAGKKAIGYLFFMGTVLHNVMYYSGNPSVKKEDAAAFFDSVVISK